MFSFNFEKLALKTETIASAMAGRIGKVVKNFGRDAGRNMVRNIEAKTSNLARAGSIRSAGQRSEALKSLVPAHAQKPKIKNIVEKPKYDVFKARSDIIPKRNIPYGQV